MAVTGYGAALTDWYGTQQAALGAAVEAVVLEVLPALDLTSWASVDATWPAVDRALAAAVNEVFGLSSGLAINYYELFRAAEGVPGGFAVLLAEALDPQQVAISLRATGPYVAKGLIGQKDRDVTAKLLALLMGSTSRLALAGGRRSLNRTGNADPQRLGWARFCRSKNPCAFCRMLRSRGPVYHTEKSALFKGNGDRFHDHCKCGAEPQFALDSPWSAEAEADRDLWDRVTGDSSGVGKLTAFRAAVAAGA